MERGQRTAFIGAEPERNAAAEPQTEAAAPAAFCGSRLATSALFPHWNGRGRKGDTDVPAARGAEENRALVTAEAESFTD